MLCQELASKRDLRYAPQNLFVRWVGLQRNLLKYFESPGRGLAITVDYNRRMNILVDQLLRLFQKLARNDYSDPPPYQHPSGTVAYEVEGPAAAPVRRSERPSAARGAAAPKAVKPSAKSTHGNH